MPPNDPASWYPPPLAGIRRRIGASLALLAGGAIAILLYLAFLGPSLTWYQNTAVVLSILIAVPALVIWMWVAWGSRVADHFRHYIPPGTPFGPSAPSTSGTPTSGTKGSPSAPAEAGPWPG